jgi:hypothetical protein
MCGGAPDGESPEAELLAEYARGLGYRGRIILEPDSRTTWENIINVIPLVEDANVIKIASNSLHAEKARGYLRKQRPDLGERLARADEHRFGEVMILKPAAALRAVSNRIRVAS